MTNLLRSSALSRLSIRHGFNTRMGGRSQGPFASFNLGRAVGDEPEAVAANHASFADAVGYPDGTLYELSQVHGAATRVVVRGDIPVRVRAEEGDALIAPAGGIAVGVRVADCVALLAVDRESGAVAAIHAGWRGVVRGVVGSGMSALLEQCSGRAENVTVALLPHIRVCCFEVGHDVAAEIARASHGEQVVDETREKPHVDLARSVKAQLIRFGVRPEEIDDVAGCTCCEPERFFSFRRDGARSGRHLAAIVST